MNILWIKGQYNSIMRVIQLKNPRIAKAKHRVVNLSQTAQLQRQQQSPSKYSFQRYRRTSLPNSIGHYSLNIRNSHEEVSTEMYFNPHKKSKFMKEIVDNYFEETLQKIYGNQKESQSRQMQTLNRNSRNIVKRNKVLFSSGTENQGALKKQVAKIKKGEEQKAQEQVGQLHQSANSSSNTASFLPPIYQSHEDFDDLGKIFPQFSQTSPQITLKDKDETQKILTFQNQAFRIYVVACNREPKYRVKQFKPAGLEILKREQRALKFGIQRIWKESTINANSFTSELVHPLKNLICKLTPNVQGNVKFKIRSSSYRKYLLSNNCLELKHLIRQICSILKKIQGRVLNNKINPSNIFILKGNRICIGEWGYSSFREQYQIQDNKFQSRVNPILKSSKQWLATPQYLSPQLLQAVIAQSDQQEPDIWQQKSSSDIWSLGITLYQVLTMVPIWINQVCTYKLKTKKAVVRSGLLGTDDRKPHKIAQKQKKLEKHIAHSLENEVEEGFNKQILQLISRMIAYNPSERISLDQIISIIK